MPSTGSSAPFTPSDFFRGYENTWHVYQVQIQDASAEKDANTQYFLRFGQIKMSVLCKQDRAAINTPQTFQSIC